MKAVTFLLSVLNVASVFSLQPIYFKVREMANETTWDGVQNRIHGGREAQEGQFPYMVFVMMKLPGGNIPMCSASLVSPDWVLLAAHCVSFPGLKPRDIILVSGKADLVEYIKARIKMDYNSDINEQAYGLQERRAKQFLTHSKYNSDTIQHDVALIQLNRPFKIGTVQTIPVSNSEMRTTKRCTILGWGLTLGNRQTYRLNFVYEKSVRTVKMGCIAKQSGPFICLAPDGTGICQGDSGSPLVCDDKVWGVASHFVSLSDNPNCGDSIEEYYSELYEDVGWILPHINAGSALIDSKTVIVCAVVAVWFNSKYKNVLEQLL